MAALLADQFELLADGAADGLLFGTRSTGYMTLSVPSIEPNDAGGAEYARSREDGVQYGEEWEGAKAATFDVGVFADMFPGAGESLRGAGADALDRFESTWRDPRWRNRFGAYAVLRSNIGGRTRRCYGRPRRFAATEDAMAKRGYSSFLCDFSVMDGKWYDDDEQMVATAPAGAAGGQRQTSLTVGGTRDAWPVVTLTAGSDDLQSPTVTIGPLSMTLAHRFFAGEKVTLDPRPWSRQFILNDNRSLPTGGLAPVGATPNLRDWHLPTGFHLATLTAEALPTNATLTVSWRNTWSRW